MGRPCEARTPNGALVRLREDVGLSQQDLADEINSLALRRFGKTADITKKTVGRWERGEVDWPQPFYRRLLVEYFEVAVDELGFHRPRRAEPHPLGAGTTPLEFGPAAGTADPRVEADQRRWREVRQQLGDRRRVLAVLAESLYPDRRVPGLEGTGAIADPSWICAEPVPLENVALVLDPEAPEPLITGTERESAAVRPLQTTDRRYRHYHHAMRDIAAPTLFENRLCFRLVDLAAAGTEVSMRFSQMGFFDSIDTNEALAHEIALHHLPSSHDHAEPRKPSWRRLKFRKLVGEPFDLTRRPLMGAIGTLTIRGGESPSIVLHQRHGGRVAAGGGMAHLLPAGIFQPSSVIPAGIERDFCVWRNIQREYAEEVLGHEEYDGSGRPIDYDNVEPFTTMDQGRRAGHIKVWYLGLVLDALTLCGDILTVAVIAPDVYDHLFAEAVDNNIEGSVPTRAVPFESHTLARLRGSGQLAPGAAAALHLAWRHRRTLLSLDPPREFAGEGGS
jgi:transcriptional regulator with XRE-family HTH domain